MRLNVGLAEKILGSVGEGNRFFSKDGRIFSGLRDLQNGLKTMGNDIFLRHAEKNGNDFSNWVRECIGDTRLADGIIGLDKDATLKKIEARINYIEKYLEKKL
jgi:hypothetical protein